VEVAAVESRSSAASYHVPHGGNHLRNLSQTADLPEGVHVTASAPLIARAAMADVVRAFVLVRGMATQVEI
jgi:hypothetical protein